MTWLPYRPRLCVDDAMLQVWPPAGLCGAETLDEILLDAAGAPEALTLHLPADLIPPHDLDLLPPFATATPSAAPPPRHPRPRAKHLHLDVAHDVLFATNGRFLPSSPGLMIAAAAPDLDLFSDGSEPYGWRLRRASHHLAGPAYLAEVGEPEADLAGLLAEVLAMVAYPKLRRLFDRDPGYEAEMRRLQQRLDPPTASAQRLALRDSIEDIVGRWFR